MIRIFFRNKFRMLICYFMICVSCQRLIFVLLFRVHGVAKDTRKDTEKMSRMCNGNKYFAKPTTNSKIFFTQIFHNILHSQFATVSSKAIVFLCQFAKVISWIVGSQPLKYLRRCWIYAYGVSKQPRNRIKSMRFTCGTNRSKIE